MTGPGVLDDVIMIGYPTTKKIVSLLKYEKSGEKDLEFGEVLLDFPGVDHRPV